MKRLEEIVKAIDEKIVCDIGTDHGYVPIMALESNKCEKVYAVDINKNPLTKAQKNIAEKNLSDKVIFKLGSLVNITEKEVKLGIIAGMGGHLIVKILEEAKEVLTNMDKLIISPHNDHLHVRKYLISIGYNIQYEKFVYENNKYYTIMKCVKGNCNYKEEDLLLGINVVVDETYINYLKSKILEKDKVEKKPKKIKEHITVINLDKENIYQNERIEKADKKNGEQDI